MKGSAVLTSYKAWPGHGLWLKGTNLGCRGLFYSAGPSRRCCCWCCCWCWGWAEPWAGTVELQVAEEEMDARWRATISLKFTQEDTELWIITCPQQGQSSHRDPAIHSFTNTLSPFRGHRVTGANLIQHWRWATPWIPHRNHSSEY